MDIETRMSPVAEAAVEQGYLVGSWNPSQEYGPLCEFREWCEQRGRPLLWIRRNAAPGMRLITLDMGTAGRILTAEQRHAAAAVLLRFTGTCAVQADRVSSKTLLSADTDRVAATLLAIVQQTVQPSDTASKQASDTERANGAWGTEPAEVGPKAFEPSVNGRPLAIARSNGSPRLIRAFGPNNFR